MFANIGLFAGGLRNSQQDLPHRALTGEYICKTIRLIGEKKLG